MIDWFCHHRLLEDIISSRLQVDVLSISRLLFLQRPLKKERDRLMKVFDRVTILIARNWPRRVNGLRKMLVEHLLPRSPVLALQHILELREGVDPGEFTFLRPLVKLEDRPIDSELDGVTSAVLMDFNKVFVFGIVATQLVDLRQGVVVIPFSLTLVERGLLVDGCQRVVLVASRVLLTCNGASHVLRDAALLFVMLHVGFAMNLSRST
jgi:hypothetical protein